MKTWLDLSWKTKKFVIVNNYRISMTFMKTYGNNTHFYVINIVSSGKREKF